MSDPAPESSKASNGQPQKASLEDLVAALGRPRPDDDEAFAEHDAAELADDAEAGSEGEAEVDAKADEPEEPDPFAEYADLDLATSLPIDPDDNLSKVKGEASPRLMSIVESLLFAADKPMTVKMIRRLLKEPTKRQIQLALKQLIVDTQHRGVVVGQVAGGFRLRTHPDNAQFVQKMLAGKPVRLSRSQLESLAVVAYRQPVTKAELDHIRGVDCGAVLRVLLERDLVKIVGRKEEPGRPHLYGTTVAFLEFFNLKGLRDLPDLQEFKELSEESEATLRHTMHGSSLAEEQEAMGQSRLEFPPNQAGEQAGNQAGNQEDGEGAVEAEAPRDVAGSEGQPESDGEVVVTDGEAESSETVRADASSELASPEGEGAAAVDPLEHADGSDEAADAAGVSSAEDRVEDEPTEAGGEQGLESEPTPEGASGESGESNGTAEATAEPAEQASEGEPPDAPAENDSPAPEAVESQGAPPSDAEPAIEASAEAVADAPTEPPAQEGSDVAADADETEEPAEPTQDNVDQVPDAPADGASEAPESESADAADDDASTKEDA